MFFFQVFKSCIVKSYFVTFFYILLPEELLFYKIVSREDKSCHKGVLMESFGRNPFMDYRNSVPFMNLAGFVMKQDIETENKPAQSLKAYLFKKRCASMINLRRLKYRAMCEAYQGISRRG
jgi:hypothetical protein